MRPRRMPEGTLSDLLRLRRIALADRTEGRSHVLAVLRDPDIIAEAIPVGDILCATPGLDEALVARILLLARVPWGRRIGLLSRHDVEAICWWTKERHPEVWDEWRLLVRSKARLAA